MMPDDSLCMDLYVKSILNIEINSSEGINIRVLEI